MSKFFRLTLVLIVFAFTGLVSCAQAEAPKVQTQVPGYYRMQLGQFEITALYDGAIELDTKLLHNTTAAELNRLLSRMFVGNPKMQTAVNAYLINTGSHLVLVDTGAGKVVRPLPGLRAAEHEGCRLSAGPGGYGRHHPPAPRPYVAG